METPSASEHHRGKALGELEILHPTGSPAKALSRSICSRCVTKRLPPFLPSQSAVASTRRTGEGTGGFVLFRLENPSSVQKKWVGFLTAHSSVLFSLINIRTCLAPAESRMCLRETCHRPVHKGLQPLGKKHQWNRKEPTHKTHSLSTRNSAQSWGMVAENDSEDRNDSSC